jgi:hypothetical protein
VPEFGKKMAIRARAFTISAMGRDYNCGEAFVMSSGRTVLRPGEDFSKSFQESFENIMCFSSRQDYNHSQAYGPFTLRRPRNPLILFHAQATRFENKFM